MFYYLLLDSGVCCYCCCGGGGGGVDAIYVSQAEGNISLLCDIDVSRRNTIMAFKEFDRLNFQVLFSIFCVSFLFFLFFLLPSFFPSDLTRRDTPTSRVAMQPLSVTKCDVLCCTRWVWNTFNLCVLFSRILSESFCRLPDSLQTVSELSRTSVLLRCWSCQKQVCVFMHRLSDCHRLVTHAYDFIVRFVDVSLHRDFFSRFFDGSFLHR